MNFKNKSLAGCILTATLLPTFFLFSCAPTREPVYFSNLKDSDKFAMAAVPESIIHGADILSISVSDINAQATAVLNPSNSAGTDPQSGYQVNSEGFIQFPLLGSIKVAGLTKNQLRDYIVKSLKEKEFSKEPIVNVRIQNFQVTVLGEVGSPGVINVPGEKISLLDAIAKSGDLPIQARKDNVLIIREENNQKTIKHINLNTNEIFTSPYYYLKQNDIVYVEPNKTKLSSTKRTPDWIPLVLNIITFGVGMYTLFSK